MSWNVRSKVVLFENADSSLEESAWLIANALIENCEHLKFKCVEINTKDQIYTPNKSIGIVSNVFPTSYEEWGALRENWLDKKTDYKNVIIMVQFIASRYFCDEGELVELEQDIHLWVSFCDGFTRIESDFFPGGARFFGGRNDADELNCELLELEIKGLASVAREISVSGPNGECAAYRATEVDPAWNRRYISHAEVKKYELEHGLLLITCDFPKGSISK